MVRNRRDYVPTPEDKMKYNTHRARYDEILREVRAEMAAESQKRPPRTWAEAAASMTVPTMYVDDDRVLGY